MGVLASILANKQEEIRSLRQQRFAPRFDPRPVRLERAPGEPLRLITEIKLRSPSAGPLSRALSVAERAQAYERSGASMISVLCDSKYFDGSFQHLSEAREACALPLLCKEFVLDPVQLDAAVAHGADAVLLIVRCLTERALGQLLAQARQRDLTPLVEVHDVAECQLALDAGAELIGVNARNLDTLVMDRSGAQRVLGQLPAHVTAVHLSGVSAASDIASIATTRADAVLLGEALMRLDDPSALLREMVGAAVP